MVLAAAATLGIVAGKLRGAGAAAALAAVTTADLWSIDRLFFQYSPPAAELFRDDAIITRLKQEKPPFRVLDVGVYPGSQLMAHDIQQVLGYHGNEIRFYDEFLGGKNVWKNVGNPAVLDLTAAEFIIMPAEQQELPGFHQVAGPVPTAPGGPGVLYQRDSTVPYARVLPAAIKVAEDQIIPAVIDPRFPSDRVLVYPDTVSVAVEPIRAGQAPGPSGVTARVAEWEPGRMRITLTGSEPRAILSSCQRELVSRLARDGRRQAGARSPRRLHLPERAAAAGGQGGTARLRVRRATYGASSSVGPRSWCGRAPRRRGAAGTLQEGG